MLIHGLLSAIYVVIILATNIVAFVPTAVRYSSASRLRSKSVSLERNQPPMNHVDVLDRKWLTHILQAHNHDRPQSMDRRVLFAWLLPSLVSATIVAHSSLPAALAVTGGSDKSSDSQPPAATIWLSGKAPRVPGAKPKDKNDVSGTKKDPSFLRSIADCKNQCENVSGPDGLSKSKEECLSECQDICCTTYEQCTFAIVPRI